MATSSKKATTKKTAVTPAKTAVGIAVKKPVPTLAKKVSAPAIDKPTGKLASSAKSAAKKTVKKSTVTPEERYDMIATAAYFRAQQRGFSCNCKRDDWISAEAQIEAMLKA